jgi:hypothetical protein
MKTFATWIQKTVVCALALAFAFSVVAETKQVTAKVTRIKGSARFSTDNNTWQALKVGHTLASGAVIQTAANSYVDLLLGQEPPIVRAPRVGEYLTYSPLGEEDTLRIYEDSVLALDKLTSTKTGADVVKETQLDLRSGTVFGKVRKLSSASKYEVKLPSGVAGIRGTIYTINAQGVLSVLTGSVVLAYVGPDGSVITQVVNAGWQFDPRTGQLTPIPDFRQKEMVRAAEQAGIGPNTPPTDYTVDETIIYVSPTQGHNDDGGGSP